MKSICIFFFMFPIALIISCESNDEVTVTRTTLDKEIFYDIDNKTNHKPDDSLITVYSKGMQKAFSLNPIERSLYENEMRIYFAGVWNERFYISRMIGDSVITNLYSCKTDRKGDSLFMKQGRLLTLIGKFHRTGISTDRLPFFKIGLPADTSAALDKGYVYFLEVKNGTTFNKLLVNDEYLEQTDDLTSKQIRDFIQNIAKTNNFNFYDCWEKIDSSAFAHK